MKKIKLLSLLMLFSVAAKADPYIQSPLFGGKVYFSQGATFTTAKLGYDQTFTNVAVLYHPLSAGSLIPEGLQAWLPPESWACTVGGGYLAEDGKGSIGSGCGVNLLDSVRGWGSRLLFLSNNGTIQAIGEQIRPKGGPVNLFAGRQENISFGGKFVPRWFFGAAFGF